MTKTELNPLTEIYLQCHEYVKEVKKQESGRYPGRYKRFEKVKINKYFDTISYKAINNLDFASETMSSLIVIHGLPNTNHRTTIYFTGVILKSLDIKFPNYVISKNKKKWINECNRYIRKSKRIIYTRKHDDKYKEKHLKWTKDWLRNIVGTQSNSSGMMSRHSLARLKKISSSLDFSSVIVKK